MRRTLALAVVVLSACESEIPPAEKGLRVLGQVSYAGELHAGFARPAVVVSLFTEFPPMSPPRGSLTIEGTSFAAPAPFEVLGVPSGRYKIVAQLVDLDVAGATGVPTGSFPNVCVLFAPMGNIEVTADAPTDGLAITLYDPGRDPCQAPRVDAGPLDAPGS